MTSSAMVAIRDTISLMPYLAIKPSKMIKMGYGYLATFEPAGQEVITAVYTLFYTFASVALAYLFANKFGYTKYLALISLLPVLVFYASSLLPITAILVVLGLFGAGELFPSYGFIINPTLIASGGGAS